MRFCTGCGSPLEKDDLFCYRCGAKVTAPREGSGPEAPPEPEAPAAQETPAEQPRPPRQSVPPARPAFFDHYDTVPGGRYAAPPRQQPGRGSYPPPRPAYPAYGRQGGSRNRHRPPARKLPLRHKGFLRFLSFLFALGLLAAAAGFSSVIYFNRYADRSLNAWLEKNKITDRVTARQKSLFADALAAAMRSDVRGAMEAQAEFFNPNADIARIRRMDSAELAPYVENNLTRLEQAEKQFGIRWTVLRFALNGRAAMIAGGALCLFSLVLWFAFGGRPSVFSKAALTPLLTMFIIWSLCIVLLAFVIPGVNLFEPDVPDRLETAETAEPAPLPFEEYIPDHSSLIPLNVL